MPLPRPNPVGTKAAWGWGSDFVLAALPSRAWHPGTLQDPLQWLAPPEGGATGPCARLARSPHFPSKNWDTRQELGRIKPRVERLLGFFPG